METRLVRRYAVLTGLQWLPTGLVIPVMVLLARARGLDVATIGLVVATHSAVAIALELPTGGLGDVLGRRPLLLAAGACLVVSTALLAVAASTAAFVVSSAIRGAGRALGSGPLEAWLVDRIGEDEDEHEHEGTAGVVPQSASAAPAAVIGPEVIDLDGDGVGDDPAASSPAVIRALAAGHVAESVALGVGVLAGGALTVLASGLPESGAATLLSGSVPVLVAAALGLLWMGALVAWLPGGTGRAGPRTASDRGGVRRTMGAALNLARRDVPLRRLLARMAVIGAVLVSLELFVPVLVADRAADTAQATAIFAALAAGAFAASAAGAALAPATGRALGTSARAAAWSTGAVAPCLVLVGVGSSAVLAVAYLAAYALLGVAGPLASTLLHDRVTASARTTVLSIESLALQAGGLAATLVLPRLLPLGPVAPWLAVAALVVVTAAAATRAPRADRSGRGGEPEEGPC